MAFSARETPSRDIRVLSSLRVGPMFRRHRVPTHTQFVGSGVFHSGADFSLHAPRLLAECFSKSEPLLFSLLHGEFISR